MSDSRSYGGDAHPAPDKIAAIAEKLHAHARTELTGEHTTMEMKTFDDGTLSATVFSTVDIFDGAGSVPPAAARELVTYDPDEDAIMYQETLDYQGGRTEVKESQRIEPNVSALEGGDE